MKRIKCTYGTQCSISIDTLNGNPVLKFDFDIKTYKICNQGWHEHSFPANVAINDKLFLNEEMKNRLIAMLDVFLETGYINDPELAKTERGFGFLEFKDLMGNIISIQDSSSAEQAKIWFGCETKNKAFFWSDNKLVPYQFEKGDLLIEDRLHLNQNKVQRLKNIINQEWNLI
jgi:hypothetical protein